MDTPISPPCPHCKSFDLFVEPADFSSCYIACNDCGARGPSYCNEIEEDVAAEDEGMEPGENAARRNWNTRLANPPADKAGMGRLPGRMSELIADPWELDDPDNLDRLREEGMFEALDELEGLQERFRLFAFRATLSAPVPAADKAASVGVGERLLSAAVGLRDDLLDRAEWDGEVKAVCAGNGAWFRFNEAIEAALSPVTADPGVEPTRVGPAPRVNPFVRPG